MLPAQGRCHVEYGRGTSCNNRASAGGAAAPRRPAARMAIAALVVVLAGCSTQQREAVHGHQGLDGPPPLYDSLGSYSYRITTTTPTAQRWFDQGLRLVYAFNHADAMREVSRQFPDDLEAATFFADAAMNLRPWNLWAPDGTPNPGTEAIVQTLEGVLARAPNHPGAIHLYIHAVEASAKPGRAEAAADRLLKLMPGAGHVVHMPSHIYWRVGRYADAVAANTAAVEADRAYFKTSTPSPIYRGLYHPHNIDFIWQTASMQGRSALTIRAAREFAASAPPEMIKQMPDMETAPVAPIVALVRFGRWDDVFCFNDPPTD